jgi:hypothetical protein
MRFRPSGVPPAPAGGAALFCRRNRYPQFVEFTGWGDKRK